jgi:hypothetical protein
MSFRFKAGLVALAMTGAVLAQEPSPAGHYTGTLQAPDREVNISVDLDKNPKGEWIGHFSINPGLREVPLSKIAVKGDAVSFAVAGIPGSPMFEGKWDKEAGTIKGSAKQGENTVDFELTRKGEAKVVLPPESTPLAPEFVGAWEGTLDAGGGRTFPMTINLKQGPDGKAAGTLVSVKQGNVEIPITTITQKGADLKIEIKIASIVYEGKMNEAKDEITGQWTQGPRTLPLTLKKSGAGAK